MEGLDTRKQAQQHNDRKNEAKLTWFGSNGPVWCPRCGAMPGVQLGKIEARYCEQLTCLCGEKMTFAHPKNGEEVSFFGVMLARDQSLLRWQQEPSGVRRWPLLARLFAARPRQTVEMWMPDGEE